MFKNTVKELIIRHVPLRRVFIYKKAAWFNRSLLRLSNKKERLIRKVKRSFIVAHRLAYKAAGAAYSRAFKVAKSSIFKTTLPNARKRNPKRFGLLLKVKRLTEFFCDTFW